MLILPDLHSLIFLIIIVAPEFGFSPQNFTVNEGENFEVSLNLSSRPDVENYQWTLNGNDIISSETRDLSAGRLALSPVNREDQGTYMVTATNVVNSASASFQLQVSCKKLFCCVSVCVTIM